MAKIAAIITDLFEDSEFTSPKEALEAAGHGVVTVGLEAGQTVTGKSEDTEVEVAVGIDGAKGEDYDALLIPGGYSPDKLRGDERVLDFVRHFAFKRKPIFSICHAPQLLVNADVLKGKSITAVKQVAVDVKNAGANFFDEEVVIDPSGIISSRTPADLEAFNKAIVDALK
ncbi:type 1 glutamine amidotransferase domain-containing protein [Aerococcus sanguinicola]|uniref:General stress protein n=1 Tax=Aerococcus sanguinicola TaxID=119206 RepID=A0A0X8FB92_9LACT|nr:MULTISPECIES: type 1 glutamine amidotransferase domain-containing protein [Aerococcus]AMB94033.1 general stress protein [Aerococcus sanguinicola]MDK7050676.1 type 1 glutamine amidotransferase domain-containing protein [Aerococcus sanguinicola]OFT93692.1 protease [Aerococcus sp. HMSC23C02]PKZ20802.1 type 1 glutamine amidotransferase [Aerococcus sanguinicola]